MMVFSEEKILPLLMIMPLWKDEQHIGADFIIIGQANA